MVRNIPDESAHSGVAHIPEALGISRHLSVVASFFLAEFVVYDVNMPVGSPDYAVGPEGFGWWQHEGSFGDRLTESGEPRGYFRALQLVREELFDFPALSLGKDQGVDAGGYRMAQSVGLMNPGKNLVEDYAAVTRTREIRQIIDAGVRP